MSDNKTMLKRLNGAFETSDLLSKKQRDSESSRQGMGKKQPRPGAGFLTKAGKKAKEKVSGQTVVFGKQRKISSDKSSMAKEKCFPSRIKGISKKGCYKTSNPSVGRLESDKKVLFGKAA